MAVVTNTFLTTNAVGNREELSDVVSRITPEDTPIYSMIEKGKCVSVHPEWDVDDLAAPAENVVPEGAEYNFDAITPPGRYGDYTQIMRKSWAISGTQEVVSEAGNVQKRKYQKLKKGVELRKDVEFAIVSPQASQGGAIRKLGGLPTWITTNASRGAGGVNGGFNTGTGLTVAPTNGTQRAFTKTLLDTAMSNGFTAGANFQHLVGAPYIKSVFVTFMSDANVAPFRYAVSKGGERNTIVATADYYEGPFGTIMIQPDRVMATAALARNAFLIDTEFLEFLWLRKIQEDKEVAKTGDADKGVLIGEGTLKPKNEKGLGVIADLFGMSASS
jgi:hypothetical protein